MSVSVAERLNIIDTIDFIIFYWNAISCILKRYDHFKLLSAYLQPHSVTSQKTRILHSNFAFRLVGA